MSMSIRLQVPVNTSLHVFQWQPFTLNEYRLPAK